MGWRLTGRGPIRRRPRKQRDERGAIAIFTALLLSTVLTGAASFSLDVGYQRVARRDMQAVADLVAMDMARKLDGRTTSALSGSTWNAGVTTSLGSQGHTVGAALTVRTCTEAEVHAVDAALSSTGICAFPGILNSDGTFSSSGSAAATHVKVMTRTSVDYFLPVFADAGSASRSAVAAATKTACFAIGSYLARLSTGESPLLNAILGDTLHTTVLGYDGLATVNLSLADLALQLGAGTPQQLLTTSVTASKLFSAMATVISKNSPQTSADINAVGVLQAAAVASTPAFSLGNMLSIGSDAGTALGATINALDLVKGAAALSDGDHFLNVPGLTLSLPGISTTTAKLQVIEGPQIYCGPVGGSTKVTSQARVTLVYQLLGLAGTIAGTPITVSIDLGLANARGTLSSIDGCPTMNNLAITLSNQTAVDLSVSIKTQANVLLGLLPSLVDVEAKPTSILPTGPTTTHNLALPQYYTDKYHTSSGTVGLQALTDTQITAKVLGTGLPVVSTLLSLTLRDTLKSVASDVNTTVLPLLQNQLGLRVAGVDLWSMQPKSNRCSTPQLKG
ncbi:hypothetical protein GCM10011584_12470 [Nocardioides phosphati]|uniref:Flp pilus-assembly TadG-like N-terminal domain-containing protein n=1 Tax=Nocardioides phosphati TaxID=1867775 RepID=A0ABQ2NA30_9ACTN|nr:hypothetical protein [Nocardioides phosphati]GGO87556.1 hypothetical protein GCM10011584_12470 [Nocardioides phosphati]